MRGGLRCLILLSGLFLLGVGCARGPKNLPVYGQIPSFQLIDQTQNKYGLADLRGKVWVADFIFTSCGMTCPLMTQRMKGIQDKLKNTLDEAQRSKINIVSFSVDPERDTPVRLAAYAKEYGADPRIWIFLTGPLADVTQTVVQGFKISMGKVPVPVGEKFPEGEIFEVVHGEKFVLVDSRGRIRGYYDSDRAGVSQLLADLQSLLKEGPA